ncbi:MAG: DUF3110 domain-containing protein [Microcystaceae cyanobacterium]
MRVFVLLFNAGTDKEGIHTLQIGDRHKILMFKLEDDATRYALQLEAQDFPVPTVEAIDSMEIEEFCRQADYDWEIVNEDKTIIPPEQNAESLDWETDAPPETTAPSSDSDSDMSSDELERIRRQLEGLL